MYTQIGTQGKMENNSENLTLSADQHDDAQKDVDHQFVQRPSFRSRNRPTVTWGPPPPAPYNVTQLPYKIDETPSSSSPSKAILATSNLSISSSTSNVVVVTNKENNNTLSLNDDDHSNSEGSISSSDSDSD